MTDAPDLDPLAENIEGHIIESHNYEHRLNHEIPWGHVALGVGIVAAAYVAHQYLTDSVDSDAEGVGEGEAAEAAAGSSDEFVNVEIDGGGLLA